MDTRYPRQVKIIRDARKAMGYSQQQVATIIGVHVRQYTGCCGLPSRWRWTTMF